MATSTWRGLVACTCAGILAIPALANVRVAIFGPDGQPASADELAYTTMDGVTYKALAEHDNTFMLTEAGADMKSPKVTIHLETGDVVVALPAGVDGIAIHNDGGQLVTKSYLAGGLERALQGGPSNAGMRMLVNQQPSAPVDAPRSLGGFNPLRGGGDADDCADAELISGEGTFAFDNSAATSVGPNHPACLAFGRTEIANDVWFCWTATDDGIATVSTCAQTTVDTRIAAYDGCACPIDDSTLLACNDDASGCGVQSEVSFAVVNGQAYLIRIGTWPLATGGTGTFSIEIAGGGGGGGADNCADAEAISGQGVFNFDNSAATTDGPGHAACLFAGEDQVGNDVWYCWTSDITGVVRVETCGQTGVDTRLAVYDGCVCPTDDSTLIACQDDACSLQSRIDFDAVAGSTYLIRVGTYPLAVGGVGTFSISEAPPVVDCEQPAANCQADNEADAFNSTAGQFTVADDFTPADDGAVSSICFKGAYYDGFGDCGGSVTDNFTITYFANNNGFPGAVIASFSQSGGTLTVTRGETGDQIAGFLPEYVFTADHAPVAVTADECYWIEIVSNTVGCSWFWEISNGGNNRALQDSALNGYDFADQMPNDHAFCLDIELGDATDCLPPPPDLPCELPDASCQANDVSNAFNSTVGVFHTADDFEVPATRGTVSNVCWWGAYFDGLGDCSAIAPDDFTVTYYTDGGGFPGAVIASFSQSGGTLTLEPKVATGALVAGFLPEYNYSATHAPLALTEGDCVWIEITNNISPFGCNWFWTIASEGNGVSVQDETPGDPYGAGDAVLGDLAFCLDSGLGDASNCRPPAPDNDTCANAAELPCNGSATVNNLFATTDPNDPVFSCHFLAPDQGVNSVWFQFMATDTSAYLQTNNSAVGDTLLAVYSGTCGSLTEIACSEDDGVGLLSELCVSGLTIGETYLVQVASFDEGSLGELVVDLFCPCPDPPANDECDGAEALNVPSVTFGSTTFASVDLVTPATCGTSSGTAPGVWYTVVGDGTTYTADTCGDGTGYDTKLSVYCTMDCATNEGTCVAGNDDGPCGPTGFQSRVSWCTQPGAVYYILVHGFGDSKGEFELALSSDGAACANPVTCLPTGACCFNDGSCEDLTEQQCLDAGGSFVGLGTDCTGGTGYVVSNCANPFEDISGTGTIAATASDSDDGGDVVPIGFTFNFYGSEQTTIGLASNGYATFDGILSDFSNDAIPSAATPNNAIYPWWDDYDPVPDSPDQPDGVVYYQTDGVAPNRRFIAQWTNMRQFSNTDSNTFQVILYEGTNCIEFRYATITPAVDNFDVTVGIENASGSEATAIAATSISQGDCIQICFVSAESPCEPGGACCFGDGSCEVLTEANCDAAGGTYSGDGTSCGGPTGNYLITEDAAALEDISGTGTVAPTASDSDDGGDIVPIGFTFNYFGDDKTEIGLASNGYATFDGVLTDFSNDPSVPTATTPNDAIFPYWDDYDPVPDTPEQPDGVVYYQTDGVEPNRRFIAQWTNMRQFSSTDSNTFQLILYEGTNCIEFRYGTITPEGSAGDVTVGIENADGTLGFSVPSASVATGDSISFCPEVLENPCEPQCDECPPGTIPLVDAQGDFAGWCLSTSHPAQLDVFVDAVVPGDLALFELSKEFVNGPGPTGVISPILIDFLQVCPDALTAPNLYIADESITNLTGEDWTDFHWVLFDGSEVWFNIAESGGYDVSPFTTAQFEDLLDANRAKKVNAFGGVVANGGSFFPGTGAGELKMEVDLAGTDGPISFTLKERPTLDGMLRLTVGSNVAGVPVEMTPVDIYGDQAGDAAFNRYFAAPTNVTLVAPPTAGRQVFRAWNVDGVWQPAGQTTLDVLVDQTTTVRAVYELAPKRRAAPNAGQMP